jgi:hypothetical protein
MGLALDDLGFVASLSHYHGTSARFTLAGSGGVSRLLRLDGWCTFDFEAALIGIEGSPVADATPPIETAVAR